MDFSRTKWAIVVVLLAAASALSQTTASCSFTYFTIASPYNLADQPNGIDHYGNVVGQASSATKWVAFTRDTSARVHLFSVPNSSATILNRRNLSGIAVGYYTMSSATGAPAFGLILSPTSYATLKYPGAWSTFLTGINRWNTMVGSYASSAGVKRGFIYSNGKFTSINYPGAFSTSISGINDSGVIVGTYVLGNFENPPHPFMIKNGVFISGVGGNDINNSATMVSGNRIIYSNGVWKKVTAPGSYETFLYGINDAGVVTGDANYPSSNGNYTWKNFTAVCK